MLFYLSPIFLLLLIYLYTDPFRVIYHYDHYYAPVDSYYYTMSNDHITTQTLIQNYPEHKYDSYIFGSSRSGFYLMSEWSKHIDSKRDYNFNTVGESLYGIEKKMQFLKKNNYPIHNALIVIDSELLSVVANEKGHIHIKDPITTGESKIMFQLEFLKDYFDQKFLLAYLHLIFSRHPFAYALTNPILAPQRFHYDIATNEYRYFNEEEIEADSVKYYAARQNVFYKRDTVLRYGKPVIGVEQKKLLMSIKEILDENHTSYRIVISPLYDQVKMDSTDIKTLETIFGKQYVFDFSGINDFTRNKYNYFRNQLVEQRF